MKIVCAGIAGNNSREYLADFREFARNNNRHFKVFDLLEEGQKADSLHYGSIPYEELMNVPRPTLDRIRGLGWLSIGLQLEKSDCEDAIIRAPSSANYRTRYRFFKDGKYVRELGIEGVVTLIDDGKKIKDRIAAGNCDPYNNLFTREDYTVEEVLQWQQVEANEAIDWARYIDVPHYHLPVQQRVDSLFKIATVPAIKKAYISFSMTNADKEVARNRDKFIEDLNKLGALFINPAAVEIDLDPKEGKDAIREHTISRDLEDFVMQSDFLCVYFGAKKDFSSGRDAEMDYARDNGIPVLILYEGDMGNTSPFFKEHWTTQAFDKTQKLVGHLNRKYGIKRMNLKWPAGMRKRYI